MQKKGFIVKFLCFIMISFCLGLGLPKTASAAADGISQTVIQQEEELEEVSPEKAEAPSDEINFMIFFAIGIVLLLAVVGAVVTVIVSGTTASIIVAEEGEE